MKSILVLVGKDFALFRRDRASLMLTFLVPFLLILLFGKIFGIGSSDSGPSGITLAVVNDCTDPAALVLVDALKREKTFSILMTVPEKNGQTRPLLESDLRPMMKNDAFRFALVLPADLLDAPGGGLHAKFLSNPRNEIETQVVAGVLEKTAFTSVPQLLGKALQSRARQAVGGPRADAFNRRLADNIAATYGGNADEIFQRLQNGHFGVAEKEAGTPAGTTRAPAADFSSQMGKFVHIDQEQVVGKDTKSPQATQMVGGWAMQFLLFAVTASAAALFNEKERGVFQRILSGPTTRSDILWSKFIYGMLLGLIQLVVLFFAGHFLFGIEIIPYIFPLIIVCLSAAAACTAFGLLISSVAKSQEAARGFATLLILLMSALGGAWFPVSLMPILIQKFAHLTLVYWAMEGFYQVLWAHAPLLQLLPTVGILLGITTAVLSVAWWRFNKGAIFD